MVKGRIEAAKLTRLEARTRVLQGAWKIALLALVFALGFVMFAMAIPQKRKYEELQEKLRLTHERETAVNAEREQRQIELRALRQDPQYLEVHARDRLDYSQKGETILRFRRDEN